MADLNTFLQSDEFKAYRKKQIEQVGIYIENQMRQIVNGNVPAQTMTTINGAMNMARLLIDLPENLANDTGVKQNLHNQKLEDMATLAQYLIRRKMVNE